MSFRRTTTINKLLAMKARKKVVQGSTGAGKTHGIIPVLIDRAAKVSNLKITVVCETIPAVKEVVEDIFKPIMQETHRWREDGWIGNPMQYKFANGSRIQFKAFDTVGKAKAAGKRDILFINEANHVAYEIADTLMTRSGEIWLDFNADVEFWAHTEVLKEPDSELLILTFQDNEAIPETALAELMIKKSKAYHDVNGDLDSKHNIKSNYWYNWWKVFGRGLIGNISELRILPLLNKCKEVPEDAIEIPSGLDFGFAPDPTCFLQLWVRKKETIKKEQDELYIKQIVYSTKLSINAKGEGIINLTDVLSNAKIDKKHKIIAESADPRAVTDMRAAGYNIEKVKKKSVATSIRTFHEYDIFIVDDTQEGNETYQEMDKYQFKKDKTTNQILGVPAEGQADHACDAARYVLMSRDMRWSI